MENGHKKKSWHFWWKKRLQLGTIYWNKIYIQHRFNHFMDIICFSTNDYVMYWCNADCTMVIVNGFMLRNTVFKLVKLRMNLIHSSPTHTDSHRISCWLMQKKFQWCLVVSSTQKQTIFFLFILHFFFQCPVASVCSSMKKSVCLLSFPEGTRVVDK